MQTLMDPFRCRVDPGQLNRRWLPFELCQEGEGAIQTMYGTEYGVGIHSSIADEGLSQGGHLGRRAGWFISTSAANPGLLFSGLSQITSLKYPNA